MFLISIEKNILYQWITWRFFEVPKKIIDAWENIFRFYMHYFSIPLLIKTLFAPWRQNYWSYEKNFDIVKYFDVLVSNLASRIIGFILRIGLIIIGLFVGLSVSALGIIALFLWLILPYILIIILCFGILILF
ncbi:MAG: hypothetical protein ABH876_00470 [Patescibacteria group bacterium]|nr:hypothetical protein [Patescibacteria group bacterium]MBU1877241.1 hypothetical protein [Patescibacteria group bacterium]